MTKPNHIAIIMDGNGRWAEQRGLKRIEGHLAGAQTVRSVLTECVQQEIPYLTLYAFSTENWKRPEEEVTGLFKLFCDFVQKELPLMIEHNVKLSMIGDKTQLPLATRKALDYALSKTAHGTSTELILALNYSGTQELVKATRESALDVLCKEEVLNKIIDLSQKKKTKLLKAELEEIFSDKNFGLENLRAHHYHPNIPDPDLIIRTSGELRLSNFYLLQAAYSEFYFTDVLWPDFSVEDFRLALDHFSNRKRRFGKV